MFHSKVIFALVLLGLSLTQAFLGGKPKSQALSSSTSLGLAVGEPAPDFELSTYDGKKIKLSSFKGKSPAVVFFYPADSTPGCTKEACTFEKKAPDFKKFGAQVIGISSGGAADKEKFVKANKLNSMSLLIDSGDKVRTLWKVPRALFGAFPGRVTYVIGKDGICKGVFDDLAAADKHPDEALKFLAK